MTVDFAEKARSYGRFFEGMGADNIEGICRLVTDDVRFKDPFNDVRGQEKLCRLLAKMFEDVADVRFAMKEQGGEGQVYFLRWHFTCRPRNRFVGSVWQIEGVSMIRFTESGRVREHVDYWDAAEQVYGRLPLLGSLIRLARRPLMLRS